MTRDTPVNNESTAYRVAALPLKYSETDIHNLFTRGYNRYVVDGEDQPDELLNDIERFGTAAFKKDIRTGAAEEPFVDEPGTLAVMATLSAICVKSHSKFEDTTPRKIQPLYDIRELYINNLGSLVRERGDRNLQQDIAEVLYRKNPGDEGQHPGRVCTGIKEMPEFGGGLYFEIPMVAASKKCLVHSDTDTSGEKKNGDLLTHIKDNRLYIPAGDLDDKYREYAKRAFKRLLDVQEHALSEEQYNWLIKHESAITEQIDRFGDSGHYERIWRNLSPGDRLIRLLQDAIQEVPNATAAFQEFQSAEALYEALEEYDPDSGWKRDLFNRISSPRSLGNRLSSHQDHRAVTVNQGVSNRYRIEKISNGAKSIRVESIDDLLELPCLSNMEERLHEKKPVRKDLYNFVRMVMWLPQYQNSDLDTITEDIKEFFSRWPWFDEQITEYQIRYEFEQDIEGNPPLPMNCDNDDMQRYCIGQDQCPYSIWGSLPFPDQMYEQADPQSEEYETPP